VFKVDRIAVCFYGVAFGLNRLHGVSPSRWLCGYVHRWDCEGLGIDCQGGLITFFQFPTKNQWLLFDQSRGGSAAGS
jgi:hypothetical protein